MKTKVFGILFAAVASLANMAFAQRTISVNFGSDRVAIDDVDTMVGHVPVPGRYWTDVSNAGNTGGTPTTLAASNLQDGSGVTLAGTQLYTCSRGGSWYAGNTSTLTGKLLYGYLDDSNGSNPAGFKVTGIPFSRYRVIIFRNNDAGEGTTGRFGYHTINGTSYSYVAGVLTAGSTANWGVTRNTQIIVGDNTMVVSGLTGDLTVLTASPGSGVRACISGFQIVETPPVTWSGLATVNAWNNSTNWVDWPVAGSNLWFFGTNKTTNVNDFPAGTVFSNITFASSATFGNANWTITGNSFNLAGNLALNTAQTVTMSTPMALQVSPTITVANTGSMTLSGALSGAYNVSKAGGGTLVLTAANTHSGATIATGGTLRVSNTLRNTSSCIASNGATLEMGAVNIFVGGHGIALNPAMVISADASRIYMNTGFDARIGNVTLRNGSTWTSDRALANYDVLVADNSSGASTVLITGAGTSYMNGAGGIHLQGVQNFTVEDTTSSADPDLVVSMIIGAQGSIGGALAGIRKQGAGTMALLGANIFNGPLLIDAGVVMVGTNTTTGTLGTEAVTNNATLVFSRSNDMTVNNKIAGNGIINQAGSGTLTLGGDNSAFVGTFNMTNGTVVPKHVNAFGAGTVNLSAGIVDMRASGAIAPTQGITLSGSPTIRMYYNSAQDLTVVAATGTTTLNVDVLDITQAGVYKLFNATSDVGVGAFSLQLVNNTPGLTATLTSDASGIYMDVSVAPKALSWKELATGDWDESTSNWATNGIDLAFANGDKVTLPNYTSLDAAVLTLKGNYTLTGLAVSGNETDYTVALDTGDALETRAFSKTGTGAFTFPGSLTVTPGSIQNVTGAMTIGTLTTPGVTLAASSTVNAGTLTTPTLTLAASSTVNAGLLTTPALTMANGTSVTVTDDASRILAVTQPINSTLTIPSAAVVPNNVNVTAGTYPAQAIIRYAGGSAPATTFPFDSKQATFKIEKEVDLGASGYTLRGGQALQIGNNGLLRITNSLLSCATARLIVNNGGSVIANQLRWADTGTGHTSTIVQDGGTITVTGNNNADSTGCSILFAHWASTATYDMSGGSFIADNAQALMGWDGTATWTISGSAYVRVQGIRLKRDPDGKVSTLNLNGGRVEIGSLGLSTWGPATSYFNWNGGTIRATDNFSVSMSTAPVTLGSGATACLDLNGKTVAMVSDFSGTGTLCITNAGRLAKSGAKVLNIPNLAFRDGAGLTFLMAEDLANSEKMITTNLTLTPGTTLTLDLNNIRLPLERYPLIEANNAITGDLTGVSVALINKHLVQGGVTATLEIADNKVYAVLSNIIVSRDLDWKDIASGIWEASGNILTTPWATNGVDVAYIDNDDPTFGPLAGNNASTVTVAGTILPRNIAFTADTTAYTVTGSGVVTASTVTVTGKAPVVVNTPLSTMSLTLGLGSDVTLTNDATRIAQQVTLPTNTTLTVPSAALFSGTTLLTTDGLYPNQARLRFEGGSSAATALPYTDRRAEIVLAKAVVLPASYWVSNGQTLRLGSGGALTLSTGEFSVHEGRLLLEGGSILTPRLLFGNASGCNSIIEQTGGTITVAGSNSTDNNQSSVMLGHWSNPAYTTYNMSGGEFIAENAWVQMALDAVTTWTITNAALVRTQGIRIKTDADGRNSTLNLNGGTLEIGWRGISTAGPATSFFNLGGGTVKALANFAINLSTAPITLVAGTTSVLDLNGYTLTNYSDFAGSGTLCITNSGRIARSGSTLLSIPNLTFQGTVGLQMVLDETLWASERIATGVLTLSETPSLTFTLDLQNKAAILKRYPLIEATNISGSLANASVVLVNNASGLTATLEMQGGKVYVVFNGGTLAMDVYWKDLASGNWDTATQNWTTNGVDALYGNDRAVVFGDLENNASSSITVTETVDPEGVAFISDKTAYSISGDSTVATPALTTFGTSMVTISAPLTAAAVQLDTGSKLTVNSASSLLGTSHLRPNATLSVVPAVLQGVPTGAGTLELLSGTYRFTNANYNAGTVKVTDANTRAEYVYSAATPVAGISGAGTFAFVSTSSAIISPVPGDPLMTFPGFTGTLRLETLGQMRLATGNWKTTFQNMPSAATLFFGKGMQYYGGVFSLSAKMVFEDGAQLTDHFQDGAQTFGQFRFGAGTAYFSNSVHLGTSSYIRIGSDAAATVWFKNSITGPDSTIEFGSGYTPLNNTLRAELDCSNSAETLKIRNNGGTTGRVTVNAWGASSLGNNLVSETTGSGSSFIVNIGDAATLVNAAIRTLNGSNADDVIALNHAAGSLTIDGAAVSTFNGKFTGVGSLVKSGNGTLTLAGNSTFAGGFVLNAGTAVPKHANAFGSNPTLTLNGGSVDLTVTGAVPPAQTNITATGTPAIRMKHDSASDMTVNGVSGTVALAVDVAGAALDTEYKLLNSNQALSPASFTLSMLNKHASVARGELIFKADGVYLTLKGYGTMIQFQ